MCWAHLWMMYSSWVTCAHTHIHTYSPPPHTHTHTPPPTHTRSPNPMVQLFTGHCQREGTNNGEKFQHEEDFGALHVQVHDHTHIHECLGAYTFNPEVQQEAWFTSLPPILVLSLSRFKYNQNSGQAEKVGCMILKNTFPFAVIKFGIIQYYCGLPISRPPSIMQPG